MTGIIRILTRAPRLLFHLAMWMGAALITASSLAYFNFEELPPFVVEKLPVRFESLWLVSLRVHVAAALITFPLCLLLMTRAVQRRAMLHRWLGRIAGVLVLLGLVPSGGVLAFDAKGGAVVTAGFLLSAAIVGWSMVKGVIAARRRELGVHRRSMLHVFAQMSVAVTSRALLFALDAAGLAPNVAYVVALWGPVLGSVVAAEWFSGVWTANVISVLKRIGHVFKVVPSLRSLRARSLGGPVARVGR